MAVYSRLREVSLIITSSIAFLPEDLDTEKSGHTRETSAGPLCSQPPWQGIGKILYLNKLLTQGSIQAMKIRLLLSPCCLTSSIRPYINSSW